MARDLIQNSQVVQDPALPVTRQATRAFNETIISAFDTALDHPLRMYASNPSDSKLNFSASQVSFPDGSDIAPGVAAGLPAFVASTLDFQTGATTGGNIVITFPSTTVGQYRRCAFTLMPGGNLYGNFTAQAATIGALADPIFMAGGLAAGWIDLEATTSTKFKTIGSATAIIEPSVSSTSRIHNMHTRPVLKNTLPELVRGGTWSWVAGTSTLTWSSDAFVQIPGLAEARNKITAGNSTLLTADGMVLYTDLNLSTGANATLTLAAATIDTVLHKDTTFIIARRLGTSIMLYDGTTLADGESQALNTGISNQNLTLLGSGVTETTSNPGYGSRGAADRTIGDTQGILDAIASMDAQIDKFFGQLRIKPHGSNVSRVIVTGVDLTMLDNVILSQELNGAIVSFTGSQIDFSTGSVYASDGVTALGINFTPFTIPTSSYFWYGIAASIGTIGADNTVTLQMQVSPAASANASSSLAPKPTITGSKKSGAVLVQNIAGTVTVTTIRQLGVGSGSGSGSGTGTAATAPASGFNLFMSDTFTFVLSQDSNLNSTLTKATWTPSPTTSNSNAAIYAMSCDKTKTFSTTGTACTISGTPSYTIAVGDIVYSGGNFRRISAVATQTSVTLDAAFPSNLVTAAGMVSQAVWTNDLVNVGDSTQKTRPRDFYPATNILTTNLNYHDSLTAADGVADFTDTARVVASACNSGLYTDVTSVTTDLFSSLYTRPAAPNQVLNYILSTNTNQQRLFIVFFPNPSNASVTTLANLVDYGISFYAQAVLSNGGYLQSAFCFSDSSGVAANCSNPTVVSTKTRVALNWNYVPNLNIGQTTGDLEVIVDGQVIPRLVAGTTLDAYYTETAGTTNTIDLWTDLSSYQRSIEVRRRQGSIDSSSTNLILISGLQEVLVGTAAQVTSGQAQYSSLQTALGALPSGGFIRLVGSPIAENITITAPNVSIQGKGRLTQITGTVTLSSGADYALLRTLRITDNVTMNSNNCYIRESWLATGKTVTIGVGTVGNDAEYMPNA